ncbi:hypothetical protein LL962_20760, partial [Xanthomonas sp. NCPPB 1067]
ILGGRPISIPCFHVGIIDYHYVNTLSDRTALYFLAEFYFLTVIDNDAAALTSKGTLTPQDPYRQPTNTTDRPSLSNADGRAADGLPMSPAVQQALPDPDALTASNGQRYYRRAVCYA